MDEHYGPYHSQYAFTKRKARKIYKKINDSLIADAIEIVADMEKEFEEQKQKKKLTVQDINYHTEGISSYQTKVTLLSQMTFDNCHKKDWRSKIVGESANWKKIKVELL